MSANTKKFQSPLAKARGLGSTHEGAHHWLMERVSAVALIPLTFWLVWSIVNLQGASYAEFTAWLAQPGNATLMILIILIGFYHGAAGLQVVIEDYVSNHALKLIKIMTVKFGFLTLAVACVVSILKVAL
jgi:succinate dehydrogenase / fumarate reductase membrane anchor subunit